MIKGRTKRIIRDSKGLKARGRDRRYVEGYRKKQEDTAWAETGAKLLARRLPREKW